MKLLSAMTLATTLLAAACSNSTTAPNKPITALPRDLTAGEARVIAASNDFAFDLFRTGNLSQHKANVFMSPLSASMALGMTANGANGTTYDQMRTGLRLEGATREEVNESYKSLIALLRGLDPSTDFRIANSIWYRLGFPFHSSFLDESKQYFDARVEGLDFASASAPTTINTWVSSQTNNRIPTILDAIAREEVMFLINAIYFKGSWRERFDAARTRDAPFHGVGGDRTVKMMHRHGKMRFQSTADFSAVDLPYGNSAYTMSVLLPHVGKSVETLAASLQGGAWTTWMSQFNDVTIDLALPRFKLEWERVMNSDLKALGMRDAFVPNGADFSRMSSRGKELYISIVKQKTYVDVNEEGTEAAAVTNVGVSTVSLGPQMIVDRPFIFVIRERLTGTIVFVGKIVKLP